MLCLMFIALFDYHGGQKLSIHGTSANPPVEKMSNTDGKLSQYWDSVTV
jgi:hypothetical protein